MILPTKLLRTVDIARPGWVVAVMLALAGLPGLAQNLMTNPGFESGTTGWSAFGPATLTAATAQSHSGSRAGYLTNRTDSWHGINQSVRTVLQPTTMYLISAWVRLANSTNHNVMLTMQKTDAGGTTYTTVASGLATSTNWTQLSGSYTLNVTGTLTNLNLYMEGPPAGVAFYADDFQVEAYDWKAQANARIEQIRKSDVRLLIVDAAGNPVPGAGVAIQQTRHSFAFGSAINGNISNPNYAAFFRTNFEWAVMENESKWYANEPARSNVTYTAADNIVNFCRTNGITLRGHTLFWAVDQNVQNWVTNLSNPNLLVHLTNRINSAVNHFKGTFQHWDVNNEMLHGNYFGNRLGNWVNPWMFQQARLQDAEVKLFVNDYNVVAGGETEAYKQQILALLASNAPVNGIGAQGHFGATILPWVTEARLDSLATLGLPIWITEYDSLNTNETVRADNLEMLYRLAFSKPAVDGILMWGFWAGSHWRGSNAAIVNLDWTLNEAGTRYQSLLNEWTTVTNGTSGGDGAFGFRGFHGSYDVMLTPPGGSPTLRKINLNPGSGSNYVMLVAHSSGSRPLLHNPGKPSGNSPLRFQLTGDAGRTFAIEATTNLLATNWTTFTSATNPMGTIWITNTSSPVPPQQFIRARLLP